MDLWTLAAEFDGVLVEGAPGPLRWRPGALALIRGARAAGVRVLVHTFRAAFGRRGGDPAGEEEAFAATGAVPDDLRARWAIRRQMFDFLAAEGVLPLVDVWEGPGKPGADSYAEADGDGADLIALARALGVDSGHGRQSAP